MFVTFFQELKQAGVPVTLREYLTLMQAMDADLASRKVEDLQLIIREFDQMAADLDRQIQIEEDRTGVRDRSHFSYSTFAQALAQRRDNLRQSTEGLREKLAAAVRERGETSFHLCAGRSHVRAIHLVRDGGPQLGLLGDQAVVVVPLVFAGGALVRRVRLRPGEQPLVDRPLAEHAAGRVVLRDDRVLHTEPRERVGGLQAARPAADDDDRILAGRVSSL